MKKAIPIWQQLIINGGINISYIWSISLILQN